MGVGGCVYWLLSFGRKQRSQGNKATLTASGQLSCVRDASKLGREGENILPWGSGQSLKFWADC